MKEHIFKHRNKICSLANNILGRSYDGGYMKTYNNSFITISYGSSTTEYGNDSYKNYNSLFIFVACLITDDDNKVIKKVFESMGQNNNFKNITPGRLLNGANNCLQKDYWKDHLDKKEFMLSCVDLIKDKEERADVLVTLLSF